MPTANGVGVGLAGVALLAACALRLAWAWGRAYGRRLGEDAVTLLLCVALAGWLLSLLCLGLDVSGAMSAGTRLPLVFVIAFMSSIDFGTNCLTMPLMSIGGFIQSAPVRIHVPSGSTIISTLSFLKWMRSTVSYSPCDFVVSLPLIVVPSIAGVMLGSLLGVRLLSRARSRSVRYVVLAILAFAGARALLKGLGVWE